MKDPNRKDVILQQVPRDLFDRALAKCKASEPPISLKWKIIQLVKTWLGDPS